MMEVRSWFDGSMCDVYSDNKLVNKNSTTTFVCVCVF